MKIVDLHTHSTASDGTLTPIDLVKEAKNINLIAIALTDHDTVAGLKDAQNMAEKLEIAFVPGVEISVKFQGPGHCHILGYFIDYENSVLKETLASLHEARAKRNILMIEKLKSLGIDISIEELKKMAGGGEIGRPHMAKILVQKGVVKDFDEAFEKYLAKGKPAYVPKARLEAEEAIKIIHQAGGLVSLAHPYYLGLDEDSLIRYVAELKNKGLDAIEAYYTDHDESYTQFCLELAKKFSLLITGGSDFHGENKPEIKLGIGKGNLRVPEEVYEKLLEAFKARAQG
ncbi:PHP domain protein [Thermodesulfatator indicus DSM 15286]|uniref:PHP domain protein n=1 Tax=Thermodesulfatator indicus (strain DSM 15286 / JCM 11887 / CIR29812) TaxID=667014 RepID=F8ADX0_THEID|nr:PHP domain-containing protein [Thermodesulfatator indicus]AEH44935.1 PHP domain protein [Thermodesulfatator indicus DSM 15286]